MKTLDYLPKEARTYSILVCGSNFSIPQELQNKVAEAPEVTVSYAVEDTLKFVRLDTYTLIEGVDKGWEDNITNLISKYFPSVKKNKVLADEFSKEAVQQSRIVFRCSDKEQNAAILLTITK